jgi:hypothetical protein
VHLWLEVQPHAMQAGSPPPEERTFEDDDGTVFVWDPVLRKFRPEDMASHNAASGAPQQQPAAAPEANAAVFEEYTQVRMYFCSARRPFCSPSRLLPLHAYCWQAYAIVAAIFDPFHFRRYLLSFPCSFSAPVNTRKRLQWG